MPIDSRFEEKKNKDLTPEKIQVGEIEEGGEEIYFEIEGVLNRLSLEEIEGLYQKIINLFPFLKNYFFIEINGDRKSLRIGFIIKQEFKELASHLLLIIRNLIIRNRIKNILSIFNRVNIQPFTPEGILQNLQNIEIKDFRFILTNNTNNNELSPDVVIVVDPQENLEEQIRSRLEIEADRIREERENILKRGVPRQQIKIKYGQYEITISNYLDKRLNAEELKIIKKWFKLLLSLRDKNRGINHLIILPQLDKTLPTGEKINGRYKSNLNAIFLYPAAFEERPHRVSSKISNLEGTLIHESFHRYNTRPCENRISTEWISLGWILVKEKGTLKEVPLCPVESPYGFLASSAEEEFCDALVKILAGEAFSDPHKKQFLIDFLSKLSKEGEIVTDEKIEVIEIEKPEIPSFKNEFTYALVTISTLQ
ncbi:hypothetical protein HRbin35_00221 [bacterium HR35]|nr:hypothetical protein HRbin35_00221 [bacterium HR35]